MNKVFQIYAVKLGYNDHRYDEIFMRFLILNVNINSRE